MESTPARETTPAIQDYLGAIYDLAGSDKPVIGARLARYMHLSAPSIAEALRRMQKDGYVRVEGRKEIRLTSKGLGIAETVARRHRLIERWLTDVLGLDWARAHDEAHRLEQACRSCSHRAVRRRDRGVALDFLPWATRIRASGTRSASSRA